MKLSKAFEMAVSYYGNAHEIRVDKDEYINLTDMIKFFPTRRIRDWEKLKSTKDFFAVVETFLNSENPRPLKLLKKKSGRYEGGVYAHDLIAMEFAMWLSPEFKLNVILAYQNGTQNKSDWNIKRLLASENYKLMSLAVKDAHEEPKHYHFSNEAKMLNKIAFGESCEKNPRENATEEQLEYISYLEGRNGTLIEIGLNFQERKIILKNMIDKKTNKKLEVV